LARAYEARRKNLMSRNGCMGATEGGYNRKPSRRQRFNVEARRGCEAGSDASTLALRAAMVESGTGHLPTEFWSSLESSVG
jgi:hypothetical protein